MQQVNLIPELGWDHWAGKIYPLNHCPWCGQDQVIWREHEDTSGKLYWTKFKCGFELYGTGRVRMAYCETGPLGAMGLLIKEAEQIK